MEQIKINARKGKFCLMKSKYASHGKNVKNSDTINRLFILYKSFLSNYYIKIFNPKWRQIRMKHNSDYHYFKYKTLHLTNSITLIFLINRIFKSVKFILCIKKLTTDLFKRIVENT